jgi:hypothetical protein
MIARRLVAGTVAAIVLAACTGGSPVVSPRPSRSVASPSAMQTESPSPASGQEGVIGASASRALARLCPNRSLGGSRAPAEGSAPAVVARIERQVEDIRGLRFTRRVPVDAVTHDELVAGLEQTFDAAYPAKLFHRRSVAWATIGAIPPGTEIRAQLEAFASSQVIGYYDEISKYLVFIGTDDPTPAQLVTLAHELTHALDDQHFGLMRLDELAAACDDEAFQAALALTEGDATYAMVAYARRYLSLEEQLGIATEGGSPPSGVAPFILRLQTWPYTAGMAFVQTLANGGGNRAIDAAFRKLPASTEQIMEPSGYPKDRPIAVDVPQLAPDLGEAWRDLDVQGTGAAWLSVLLGLRIDQSRATEVARGWNGGIYRAWTDGDDTAVVLRTSWEGEGAASDFASAMRDWVAAGEGHAEVQAPDGTEVTVLFASSDDALSALRSAV